MQERLQKIIAEAGLASRREAEKMILAGRISINNHIVRKLGIKANFDEDEIRVDGALIHPKYDKIYIMLNKPKGYVSTLHDPQQRPIITDLLTDISSRVFPVGRLDYNSEGLLLMTNDGDFAEKIIHPRYQIPKVYRVKIMGRLSKSDLSAFKKGIELKDGKFLPDIIHVIKINNKSSWLSITIREGKNRVIRRALSFMGYDVVVLMRTRIGGLELSGLKKGQYRLLTKGDMRKIFSI